MDYTDFKPSASSPNHKVRYRQIDSLMANPGNPRTHTQKQIRQIAASIKEFGFVNPVLVDGGGGIVAGHGRVAAARMLGMDLIPTLCLDHLSPAQLRAFLIADNRVAETAGWDRELLAFELQYLIEIDADFDVTVTGFETGEIDVLIEELETDKDDEDDDEIPGTDPSVPPISRPGDLWLLGRHRLLCGDARDPEAFAHLMAGEQAGMVFADPPYNVRIDGHVCGKGSVRHPEFAMASGEMTATQFTAFLETVLANMAGCCVDGAVLDVCMDWRHLGELLTAGNDVGLSLLNLCVWVKTNAGMGSLYRSQHELVLVFKKGTAAQVNNVELGRHGRSRTNVWSYPGMNALRRGRLDELRMHPTVKPVALVKDAILDCSQRGDIVLDGFAGSGTTVIAAEKTGRRGFAMEIDGRYVDTAIKRWQALNADPAVHAATGRSFDDVARIRAGGGRPDVGMKEVCSGDLGIGEADDVG